jgi:hypothetical protein
MFLVREESQREVERPKQAEKGLKSGMNEEKKKSKVEETYIQGRKCWWLLKTAETA